MLASTALRKSLRTTTPPTAAPPALLEPMLTSALMDARSAADTVTLPPAETPIFDADAALASGRTVANALALMRLLANTRLADAPAPLEATWFLTVAVNSSLASAVTLTSPPVCSDPPSTVALTDAGISSPRLLPSSASRPADNTFWARQPIVLKARVAPTAVPPLSVMASFAALMIAALRAEISASPPAIKSLSRTCA